jgi:hypothetical protein
MHKVLLMIPVILAACAAAGPEMGDPFAVEPVTRESGWAGCEAEGGTFQAGDDGGLVCTAN